MLCDFESYLNFPLVLLQQGIEQWTPPNYCQLGVAVQVSYSASQSVCAAGAGGGGGGSCYR